MDLKLPTAEKLARIQAAAPTLMIAPPSVLADIGRQMMKVTIAPPPSLQRLFFGAEPMGARERHWLGGLFGVRPDPIYQATEGFLGAPCPHGTLHLNEDAMAVEWQGVPGTSAAQIRVTDLHRTSQPIIRVLLDDLIYKRDEPCSCDRGGTPIHPVMGRVQDMFHWPEKIVTPAQIWDRIDAVIKPEARWQVEGTPVSLIIRSPERQVHKHISRALQDLCVGINVTSQHVKHIDTYPKRRRVIWRPV